MKILVRLRYMLRQRQMDQNLAEEIEVHRQMNGDTRAMGNITRAREDARAVWIWPWLEGLWQDVAYAIRNVRRSPGFAAVALLTLGTAIGLNTSFFTVFNAIALRPWPVADPSHIVKIFALDTAQPNPGFSGIGIAEYRYFQEHARSFTGFGIARQEEVSFGFESFGRPSRAVLVGGDQFRVLGVGMLLGRGFLPEEDRAGAPEPVIILSYPYWRDHFGSDPSIIGRQVSANDLSFTVVGVTPEDFTGIADGGRPEDVYFPLPVVKLLHSHDAGATDILTSPDQCCYPAMGRLAPGVSRTQGAAELEVLEKQFLTENRLPGGRRFQLTGSALLDNPNRKSQAATMLTLLFVGVTLILLLACANVGNLLIARSSARRQEIQIRRAIGASRGRIVRQLMTESLILALGSVALGLPIARWLPAFVIGQTGESLALRFTTDRTVLAYAIALAVFSCIAFGLAPALHGTSKSAQSRMSLRSILLAAQVALSVVLLVGAGLALQGVAHVRGRDPGFKIDGVSVVSFELPARDYNAAQARAFNQSLQRDLAGMNFGITRREPLSISRWQTDFRISGQPHNTARITLWQEVTAGYFGVLHIPLIAGRNFTDRDGSASVILINQTLARMYWNNDSPVGKSASAAGSEWQIVGVVGDSYADNLDRVEPTVYIPFRGDSIPKLLVSPADVGTMAAIAARIEPRARTQALPLTASVERWFNTARIGAEIAGMLGVFALILATVGMAGVFAYVVQQRTKEIGIRMALGARSAQVVKLVLASSSRAVIIGLGVGVAFALVGSRLMRNLLYGVSPLNPIAYFSVAVILGIAGLAASFAPARKASRVDPLQALRHE